MSHVITLGDVLETLAIALGVIIVVGALIGVLSVVGSAFKD